jgi:hypothetical protein
MGMRTRAIGLIFSVLIACTRAEPDALPNVKLGMSPRDVRDRFAEQGSWETRVGGAADDTVLDWTSTASASSVAHARFEFHLGMLVAIHAHLREPSSADRVSTTAKTVTLRRPAEGGTDVTVIARDCPTHHDEAESIVKSHR